MVGATIDGEFHQHGVVVGRDDGVGGAEGTVETHAEAASGAVGEDLAEVRGEVVFWIFGGDAALDGEAGFFDAVLGREVEGVGVELVSLSDEDL